LQSIIDLHTTVSLPFWVSSLCQKQVLPNNTLVLGKISPVKFASDKELWFFIGKSWKSYLSQIKKNTPRTKGEDYAFVKVKVIPHIRFKLVATRSTFYDF